MLRKISDTLYEYVLPRDLPSIERDEGATVFHIRMTTAEETARFAVELAEIRERLKDNKQQAAAEQLETRRRHFGAIASKIEGYDGDDFEKFAADFLTYDDLDHILTLSESGHGIAEMDGIVKEARRKNVSASRPNSRSGGKATTRGKSSTTAPTAKAAAGTNGETVS